MGIVSSNPMSAGKGFELGKSEVNADGLVGQESHIAHV